MREVSEVERSAFGAEKGVKEIKSGIKKFGAWRNVEGRAIVLTFSASSTAVVVSVLRTGQVGRRYLLPSMLNFKQECVQPRTLCLRQNRV